MFGHFNKFHLRAAVLSVALFVSGLSLSSAATVTLVSVASDIPSAIATATKIGLIQSKLPISIDVVLPMRDRAGAEAYATQVSNRHDPIYCQYLAPEEFAARFGASPTDYAAVRSWAIANGLQVTVDSTSHIVLGLSGTAAQVSSAFGVHLYEFKPKTGATFFAADTQPTLPAAIASKVSSVIGLSNFARLKPQFRVLTPSLRQSAADASVISPNDSGYGNGHYGAYDAADLNSGYKMPGGVFNGAGETLAVYEEGGFFPDDPSRYEAYNHLPSVPIIDRNVNGYGGGVDNLGVATEAALDIEMELAIAPDAKQILVYEDGDSFDTSLLNVLAAVGDDDKTSVLDISYGLDEALQGDTQILDEESLLLQLAIEGISVLASSGDNGCVGDSGFGLNVLDPGSDPLVTCVGGTSLYEFGGVYAGEETWNHIGIGGGATGGGVSQVWTIPGYQLVGGSSVALANGGSATLRNVPDVAAVGDPLTAVDVADSAYVGGWVPVGGTSASAPIWAGYIGLVNQARKMVNLRRLGFANPAIYDVGTNGYLSFFDFNDIIDGNNGNMALFGTDGYTAGFGYDNVSGFGSMIGNQLLTDLATQPTANVNPPNAPTGFSGVGVKHGVVLTWKRDTNARGYYIYAVNSAGTIVPLGGTTMTTFTVGGLTNGGLYEFDLGAVNRGGITYVIDPIYVFAGAP